MLERDLFHTMKDMMQRICKAYFEPSSICYHLINYDLTMEFLDQCLEDLDCSDRNERTQTCLKEIFIFLKNYLELLTKDRIHGGDSEKLLIALENVAYEMVRYLYFEEMCNSGMVTQYYGYRYFTEDIQSRFNFGVLTALVLQPGGFGSSAPLMSDEFLIRYVKYVQDCLLDLLRNNTIGRKDTLKGQLVILQNTLSFWMHLLITYPPEKNSEQEDLSNTIRLEFQTLVRNLGSAICSCFEDPNIETIRLGLFDLIEKADIIKGEIIKSICCMILQERGREYPKKDQLGSLVICLQNLKDFMDQAPGLIVTWNDHENLVLMIFYLIQNNIRGDNRVGGDELPQNSLHFGAAPIGHEELNGVLVSAQVVAFNLACSSLLRRYGKFHWWELYLGTKKHVDLHMCVGILNSIMLSSTTPLSDEILIAYGECVLDSVIKLLTDKAFDPLKDKFKILVEGLSLLTRLLLNYRDEQEKLSPMKAGFQDLVRGVGSVVCSCFSHWLSGDMTAKQITTELSNLVEHMKLSILKSEEIIHLVNINKIGRESPKTFQLGTFNLVLQNWKALMECDSDMIIIWKAQLQGIHENLVFFESFIISSIGDDESQNLCQSIMNAGHVAEYLLTIGSVGVCPIRCTSLWISEFTKHVELIKAAVAEANEKKGNMREDSTAGKVMVQVSTPALLVSTLPDLLVGFGEEMKLIKEQLSSDLTGLDVISIIGMPGLGKTTLARKVFEDRFTITHFEVRAWCCISQEYNKKELFLTILGSKIDITDKIKGKNELELSTMVYQELMGRRYLIVLDDIWSIDAFTELCLFFPDDSQGSRIMLTSRSKVIGSQAQRHSDLIEPALLTGKQSWDLLEQKVYNREKCPAELCQIGAEIAKKCGGLPLTVVVVGGVLAMGIQKRKFWEQVMANLNVYLAHESKSQFMAALELSYAYRPDYLKPMFLYLGAFPKDKEIHADKLMRIWMAEGFLQNTESTSKEIQAEKNLMELIDRSLLMVAQRRSDERVKACHVHDLMHDMCLGKAKEEKFMQQVHAYNEWSDPVMYQQRLSVLFKKDRETTSRHLVSYKDLPKFSIIPPIYSLFFFHVEGLSEGFRREDPGDIAPVITSLKLLKVFDAGIFEISQDVLDTDLIMLVQLRYLSISADISCLPLSISRLRSLETLIIKLTGEKDISVPETIWEMKKLRHLLIDGHVRFSDDSENLSILENLETISTPVIDLGEEDNFLRKVPGLKKLKCIFYADAPEQTVYQLPNLESLGKLESLTMTYSGDRMRFTGHLQLPFTLKKLSMSYFCLRWTQVSMLHKLPNLEVLKVCSAAVAGRFWDMGEDDVFTNLKFLKLFNLNIKRWSASSENFPSLEEFVLDRCNELTEIPSHLGEIYALQKLKVRRCGRKVARLAKEFQEEQEEIGNDLLNVYIQEVKEDDKYLIGGK